MKPLIHHFGKLGHLGAPRLVLRRLFHLQFGPVVTVYFGVLIAHRMRVGLVIFVVHDNGVLVPRLKELVDVPRTLLIMSNVQLPRGAHRRLFRAQWNRLGGVRDLQRDGFFIREGLGRGIFLLFT